MISLLSYHQICPLFGRRGLPEPILLDGNQKESIYAKNRILKGETPFLKIWNRTFRPIGFSIEATPLFPQAGLKNHEITLWTGDERNLQSIPLPRHCPGRILQVEVHDKRKKRDDGHLFEFQIFSIDTEEEREWIETFASPISKKKSSLPPLFPPRANHLPETDEKEPLLLPSSMCSKNPEEVQIQIDFCKFIQQQEWEGGYPTILQPNQTKKSPAGTYINGTSEVIGLIYDPTSLEPQIWIRTGKQRFECHQIPSSLSFLLTLEDREETHPLCPFNVFYRIEQGESILSSPKEFCICVI